MPSEHTRASSDPLLEQLQSRFDDVFRSVCQQGYQVLGRTRTDCPGVADNPWQSKEIDGPSYDAMGRYRVLATIQRARRFKARNILEVAAGDGFAAACMVDDGTEVTVNDLRPIDELRRLWTTGDHLHWTPGNLFELDPAETGQFDLVVACEVIEHIAHGDQFLAHLRRLVRPGGWLLVTTPNGEYFRSRLPTWSQIKDFTALESQQFRPDADGHLYLYTEQELSGLLRRVGFATIESELLITPFISGNAGMRFLPRHRALLPSYLTLDHAARRLGERARRRLCTQLIVSAQAPADPSP